MTSPDGPSIVAPNGAVPLDAFVADPAAQALLLTNTEDVLALGQDILARATCIVLELPTFADGRAYTQARLLRERCGYRGRLRIRGEVLRDQLFYLRRCGFDEFELGEGETAKNFQAGWDDFSVRYQPAADVSDALFRSVQRAPTTARSTKP